MQINTRSDLDRIQGTQEHQQFMQMLAASLKRWAWVNGEWELVTDASTIGKYGFTAEDFSDPPVPEKPDTNPDQEELDAWRKTATVSRFQAKAALHQAGLLEQVESFVNQSADPLVKLAWQEAQFYRSSQMVNAIGGQLNLTPAQVDDLFKTAEQIQA